MSYRLRNLIGACKIISIFPRIKLILHRRSSIVSMVVRTLGQSFSQIRNIFRLIDIRNIFRLLNVYENFMKITVYAAKKAKTHLWQKWYFVIRQVFFVLIFRLGSNINWKWCVSSDICHLKHWWNLFNLMRRLIEDCMEDCSHEYEN